MIAQCIALIGGVYCLGIYIATNLKKLAPGTISWYIHNMVGSSIILFSNFLGAVNAGSILLEICYISISIYYLMRK